MPRCSPMPDSHALLRLVQWLSPAFPTGGFAYSHGLEVSIAGGEVTTAAQVQAWMGQILRHGAGRQDAILLTHALRPGADLDGLASLARALAPSAERLAETLQQGAAFARATAALTGQDHAPRPLPIAVGQAAKGLNLPPEQVIALYLHSFAANLVSVAVRFVPLGQTEGQAVLQALHPLITALAGEAAKARLDDITSSTFRADMAAMQHETMDVRIFKT
ncbi:MAG: urease accessory UreF family protein [Pseudomonadota bacterium]